MGLAEIDISTLSETPLQKSLFALLRAVAESDYARVQATFVEYGKQIPADSRDKSGRTLLMIACQTGSVDIMKCLFENGADCRATTGAGISRCSDRP